MTLTEISDKALEHGMLLEVGRRVPNYGPAWFACFKAVSTVGEHDYPCYEAFGSSPEEAAERLLVQYGVETTPRGQQIKMFRTLVQKGVLRKGMKRADVVNAIGAPDDIGAGSRRYRAPRIFKYGDIEIGFGPRFRDGLDSIWADHFSEHIEIL